MKFNHIDGKGMLLIPFHISKRCIVNAKTDECKARLVKAAELSAVEYMKRMHVKGYDPFYQEPTFRDAFKFLFKRS